MSIFNRAMESEIPDSEIEETIIAEELDEAGKRLSELQEEIATTSGVAAEAFAENPRLKLAMESTIDGIMALVIAAIAAAIGFIYKIIASRRNKREADGIVKLRECLKSDPFVSVKREKSGSSIPNSLENIIAKQLSDNTIFENLSSQLGVRGPHLLSGKFDNIREYIVCSISRDNHAISEFRQCWDMFSKGSEKFLDEIKRNNGAPDTTHNSRGGGDDLLELEKKLENGFMTWGRTSEIVATELLPDSEVKHIVENLSFYDWTDSVFGASAVREIIKHVVNEYDGQKKELDKVARDFTELRKKFESVKKTVKTASPEAAEVFRLIGKLRNILTNFIRFNEFAFNSAVSLHNALQQTVIAICNYRAAALKVISEKNLFGDKAIIERIRGIDQAMRDQAKSLIIHLAAVK